MDTQTETWLNTNSTAEYTLCTDAHIHFPSVLLPGLISSNTTPQFCVCSRDDELKILVIRKGKWSQKSIFTKSFFLSLRYVQPDTCRWSTGTEETLCYWFVIGARWRQCLASVAEDMTWHQRQKSQFSSLCLMPCAILSSFTRVFHTQVSFLLKLCTYYILDMVCVLSWCENSIVVLDKQFFIIVTNSQRTEMQVCKYCM